MKYLRPFEWSGETFEERFGEPEAFDAALGKAMMNFSDLEHTVDRAIRYLTGLQPGRPIFGTATLSFKRKVDLLSSTVSELKDVLPFNTGPASVNEFFGELKHNCFQADSFYCLIAVCRWGRRLENGAIEVFSPNNPSSEQDQRPIGILDAHKLLDIADFICGVASDLEEFFLDLEVFMPEAA